MKKAVLLVALIGILGVSVASTQARGNRPALETETISVSGSAVVDDWGRVAVRSGNHTYHLMPAFALPETVEIASGDRVELTGYEMPGPRFGVDEGDHFIRAIELTVGGRTYVLDSATRGSHMRGGRGGRPGGDDFSRSPQGRDDHGRHGEVRRAPRR